MEIHTLRQPGILPSIKDFSVWHSGLVISDDLLTLAFFSRREAVKSSLIARRRRPRWR